MNSKNILSILFALSIFFMVFPCMQAQESDDSTEVQNYEPRLSLEYLKKGDGTRVLTGIITVKQGKEIMPVENADIKFYAGYESEVKLGSTKSDKKGRAVLEIKPEFELPLDDTGHVRFMAEYEGEQNSESISEEFSVLDMSIEMTLEVIDSIKTITIKASRYGKGKQIIPLGDKEINFYVKRMHSDLKLGSVYLDAETGEGSAEFPVIPGDSAGNIVVIARIAGDEVFGTVENRQVVPWGTPVEYITTRNSHELWSHNAPIWMTITLYIFLAGVWYHLIMVFRRMVRIKKLGTEARKEEGFK